MPVPTLVLSAVAAVLLVAATTLGIEPLNLLSSGQGRALRRAVIRLSGLTVLLYVLDFEMRHVERALWLAWSCPVLVVLVLTTNRLARRHIDNSTPRGDPRFPTAVSRTGVATTAVGANRKPPELEVDSSKPLISAPATTGSALKAARTITVYGQIDGARADQFSATCSTLIKMGRDAVTFEICTLGGEVEAALAMREDLRILSGHCTVHVLVKGVCYSAGVSLLTGVPLEQRYATHDSRFMIHPAYLATANGAPRRARNVSERRSNEEVNQYWVIGMLDDGTRLSRDCLARMVREDGEVFFGAEEALRLGVVGGIV